MRKLTIDNITIGMVTAAPAYSKSGQLIIPANSVLTKQMISHARYYNITSLDIIDGDLPQTVQDSIAFREKVEQQYTNRLRNSISYQKFEKKYSSQVSLIETSLNDIILKNADIEEPILIKQTVDLFEDNPTTFSLLGMLHDMQQLDDSTYAHCVNVSIISRLMGTWLNFSTEELDTLTLAGLLHDIGKCQIPQDILLKPGKLTRQEYEFIKLHPQFGYDIVKDQSIDIHIKNTVLLHHERRDGSGYPFGLKDNEIDEFASIISIADVYDAMTADRCYRNGLCPFNVIASFEEEGLHRYNPKYIHTFLKRIAQSYINSEILLSNNTMARIVFITEQLTRPIVQTSDGTFIDLNDQPDLYINAII